MDEHSYTAVYIGLLILYYSMYYRVYLGLTQQISFQNFNMLCSGAFKKGQCQIPNQKNGTIKATTKKWNFSSFSNIFRNFSNYANTMILSDGVSTGI